MTFSSEQTSYRTRSYDIQAVEHRNWKKRQSVKTLRSTTWYDARTGTQSRRLTSSHLKLCSHNPRDQTSAPAGIHGRAAALLCVNARHTRPTRLGHPTNRIKTHYATIRVCATCDRPSRLHILPFTLSCSLVRSNIDTSTSTTTPNGQARNSWNKRVHSRAFSR